MLPGNEPIQIHDTKDPQAFLKLARERAAYGIEAWKHNFAAAKEDLNFAYGEQWPADIKREREEEGRPCLTINELPQYISQVTGDQRQNKPGIQVRPAEGDSASKEKLPNQAGTQDYSRAEIREGLIRQIENNSKAPNHYDRAFQHAVESGWGWLRVLTCYATDEAFDLDIKFASIKNRFSVIMDPDAQDPLFADSNWGFVFQRMLRSEFRKRYPDKSVGDLSVAANEEYQHWTSEEHITVAEYFYREPRNRELLLLSDGRTVWFDEVKSVLDELEEMDVTITRRRKVKVWAVKWRKITAYDILEDEVIWPGTRIPLVPVLGKEITIGDKTYYQSLIRHSKDSVRMQNFWLTAATERVALAPKSTWVATAEAVEGFEEEWQNANVKNPALLRYNQGADKPTRDAPPAMPVAELQLALSFTDKVKSTIGLYDANVGAAGNETSGKAILARQRQGDRGTFTFNDNLDKAVEALGEIANELIPYVYDGERTARILFEDGEGDFVQLNQTVIDEQTGKPIVVNDIGAGKYDLVVKSGPSYQTKRIEATDSMMAFVQAVPAAGALMMDLIAKNQDWPGAQEIATRLKKALPPGTLDQQELEEEGIEPPQPTPEQQAAMAESQAAMEQAKADMAKAEADKEMAAAKKAEAQLKMAEIEQAALMAGSGTIEETVRNLVAEAMAELMNQGATA